MTVRLFKNENKTRKWKGREIQRSLTNFCIFSSNFRYRRWSLHVSLFPGAFDWTSAKNQLGSLLLKKVYKFKKTQIHQATKRNRESYFKEKRSSHTNFISFWAMSSIEFSTYLFCIGIKIGVLPSEEDKKSYEKKLMINFHIDSNYLAF